MYTILHDTTSTIVDTAAATAASDGRTRALPRTLGTLDLAFTAIAIVVGSGIFLVPGLVLVQTGGHVGLALLVWLVAGVLSLFGALTYAEMGAMHPEAGGIYVYIRDAFGPLPAFLYGWTTFIVIGTGSAATLAVAFSTYLGQIVPMTPLAARGVSVLLLATLAAVNVRGTRGSVGLQNWTTGAKVAGVAALALVLLALGDVRAVWQAPRPPLTPALAAGFGAAMISVLWAYEGWQYATSMAGEARDPQRTFPRAIGLATAAVTVLYVLTNLGYLAALGPDAMARSQRVAADALTARVGSATASLVSALILLSILSSTNSSLLAVPRIYFAMARDGVFFERLAVVHPRFRTPAFAIGAMAVWAAVLAATGTFEQLLTYVVFTAWIFYGLGALSIFAYRRRLPDAPRPFRVPGYPVTPILFVGSAAALVLNTLVVQPARAGVGLGVVLAGVPAYYWWRARGRRRVTTP